MKKIAAILFSAMLLLSFTACNSVDTESSVPEEGASSVSSEEAKKSSESSETSESSKTSGSSETSEIVLSKLDMPEKAGGLLKAGLKEFLVNLDKDDYCLKIDMSTSNSSNKIVIITRSGDNITAATGESEKDLNKSIVKNNKTYVIDDDAKTVTWAECESGYAEGYTEYLASLFYITNIEPTKSGKEKYGDKEMDYEEYKIIIQESSSDSSNISAASEDQYVRYYFDNGNFAGMKIINGDDYYSLKVASLTHEIPNGEFNYPSDYKLVEYVESSVQSEAESSKSESSTESIANESSKS